MRIAVVGAGGVGGYFGLRLARGGADVTFLARGAHLAAMCAGGLSVEGAEPMHLAPVNATDDPSTVGPADYVLLAVKLWDSEAALRQMRPLVGPASTVVSFQNGVLKDDILRQAFGADRVLGGVAYISAAIERPGVIRQTGTRHRLVFGEMDGARSVRGEAFLEACLRGGIRAELSLDIRRELWEKYVFLVGVSAATTAMRTTIGPIREHPQTRALLTDVMREVVAVGRAHGVALTESCLEERLAFIDSLPAEMTSSMHHDLERGNRLEVRWLSGGVVELGAAVGVPTPLNRALADVLALHAAGRTER
jgi:2-dehydropantoate 2-reductase